MTVGVVSWNNANELVLKACHLLTELCGALCDHMEALKLHLKPLKLPFLQTDTELVLHSCCVCSLYTKHLICSQATRICAVCIVVIPFIIQVRTTELMVFCLNNILIHLQITENDYPSAVECQGLIALPENRLVVKKSLIDFCVKSISLCVTGMSQRRSPTHQYLTNQQNNSIQRWKDKKHKQL